MTTALLIIDVQHALCTGPYALLEAGALVEKINQVSADARSAGAVVAVIQHEEPGGPMAHGADGWQLAAGLVTAPTDIRVRKTACDAFHQTPLQEVLQARGITELVVCGLQTEYCVDTTIRRALGLGYPITLISDGHSTMDNGVLSAAQIIAHHNETLSHLDNFGQPVRLVPAAELRIGA